MEKVLDLGANVVGGCCGSTPEYIRKMVERFGKRRPMPKDIGDIPTSMTMEGRTLSSFWKKLGTGEKAFVVELDPPFNEDISKVMQGAKLLKEAKVDLLTLSDSPLGRTRMDPMLLGAKIQKESGIFVMPHVACRDRNLISLRGMLLGSYVNDIRHFLMVTGDPVPAADRSHVTSVFDYNSIRFMNMAKMMNSDVFAKDTIVYGGALNYHGRNVEAIAKRMQLKMDQGCSYFLTQPVYSQEDIQRVAQLKEMTGANIIAGIMPLVSYKNAMFMTNEMPGIHIPDEIVSRYHPDMTREEAEDVAVSTSLDIARNIAGVCDGYYLMTPFNRVTLIVKIIDAIRDELA
jgi:homocysteine S-methyltransferase